MTAREIAYTGGIITEPGIYRDVPIEIYHSQCCDGASVSSSGLRTIESKTPEHFYDKSDLNPDRPEEEPKAHLNLGKAVHTLILGDEAFRKHYAVRPEIWTDWRKKDAQEWRDMQVEAGKIVLVPDDLGRIHGMADRLAKDPYVQAGLLSGQIERSLFWKDQITGVWLKNRPDVIPPFDNVLVDLKTTRDASSRAVNRAIFFDYRYDMQGALAGMGMQEVLGREMAEFVLIFVETERPFSVNSKPIDPLALNYAARQVRRAINKFARCVQANEWPGYEDNGESAYMPTWLQSRLDMEADAGLLPDLTDGPTIAEAAE